MPSSSPTYSVLILTTTQEVPRHTRLHPSGSTRVTPTSRGASFPPPSSRGGILSLRGGKEFPSFLSHVKRRRFPQERREELQCRATIPKIPRCLSPFQGNLFSLHCLDFQNEDRLTPRWLVGQPCGKASWESLLGKPRGKATDPLIHGKASVTLLLQLGRKAHVQPPLETRTDSPGETPEVPQDPCQHWRGILRFRH